MRHCLYCNEVPESEEHPLSAALGEFSAAPTLINRICKQCNERRIGLLDEQFVRCGPVAVLRKRYGIEGREHHQKVNPFYRGSAGGRPIRFLSWDESFQCELLIEPTGGDQACHLVQLILKGQSGPRHHIPLTPTMTPQDLSQMVAALKLTFPLPEARLIYDPATEQWAADLYKKLWPDTPLPEGTKGATRFQGGIIQFQTTSRYYRAIAKIGFHYFLTQFPNFSGHESIFSEIRDFIVDDAKEFLPARINQFIGVHRSPLAPPSNGWVGHLLCAEIREGACFAHFEPFFTPSGSLPAFMVRLGANPESKDSAVRSHIYLYYAQGKAGRYSGDAQEISPDQIKLGIPSCAPAIAEHLIEQ
jgi:hypothetical protein